MKRASRQPVSVPARPGRSERRVNLGRATRSVTNITRASRASRHGEPAAGGPARAVVHFVGHKKNSARSLFRAAGPILYCCYPSCEGGDLNPYGVTR